MFFLSFDKFRLHNNGRIRFNAKEYVFESSHILQEDIYRKEDNKSNKVIFISS